MMKYTLSLREIPRAKPNRFPGGLRLYFIVYPDSSQNTDLLNYNSSTDLPGRSILEELIFSFVPTAGQYRKILPCRFSNTEELNSNIIMFSN